MVVRRFVCAASFCLVFSTLIMLFKWNYPSCNMRAWVHCAMTDPYTFKRISPKLPLVIGHEYDHNIIYDHSQSIDAVILWVNGSDPILREQMEAYPPSSAMYDSAGLSSSRVRDLGFVKSLILSISKNAPWMRNIYVVSGTHRPSWWWNMYSRVPNIIFLRHSEFIPQDRLPTFNSEVILAHMDLIPGIAELFVHFDDDFLLPYPVTVSDFLNVEKRTTLFQSGEGGRDPGHRRRARMLFQVQSARTASKALTRALVVNAFPDHKFENYCHRPTLIEKSVLSKIKQLFKGAFEHLFEHKYRDLTILTMYLYTNVRVASGIAGKYASHGVFEMNLPILFGEQTCSVDSVKQFFDEIPRRHSKFAVLNDGVSGECTSVQFEEISKTYNELVSYFL